MVDLNNKKENSSVLTIVIIALVVVMIAMIVVLVFVLISKDDSEADSKNVQAFSETTTEVTMTTEAVTTTEVLTTVEEPTPEKPTTKKAKETTKKTAQNGKNHEGIIEIIRNNYYGIQNNLSDFTKVDTGGSYQRWNDANGTMRKIVLPPNEAEFRTMTNEYYYDENGMFQFAFVYDSDGNEYRYYFYENKVYRYIDAEGNVTDYEQGEDSYITEDIGTVYSNGEREKHF